MYPIKKFRASSARVYRNEFYLLELTIKKEFYTEKDEQKVENICISKKILSKKRHAAKNFGLTPLEGGNSM